MHSTPHSQPSCVVANPGYVLQQRNEVIRECVRSLKEPRKIFGGIHDKRIIAQENDLAD